MDRIKFFRSRQKLYQEDPVIFFREVLAFEPDPWQMEVARDVAQHRRVSVRSGQGVGKTGLEAALLLWFLSCFPFSRVVATAPTRQQLHDVLWSEVAKWQSRSPLDENIHLHGRHGQTLVRGRSDSYENREHARLS